MIALLHYSLQKLVTQPKKRTTTVLLPDMFQSFLKDEPVINPHYAAVKVESEDWINNFCSFAPRMQMKITKCDFSYFCAITAPHAPLAEYRTLCDWGNWVFPYDDMFDNGELRDQPEEAKRVMESLLIPMVGGKLDSNRKRIIQVHDTVVERISQKCSTGIQRRFAKAMYGYCYGALQHVDDYAVGQFPSLDEMVSLRRDSSGARPLYHLVEYAHDLNVPDEAFDDPIIRELEDLGIDMVSITNDILSYRKEQLEGVPHNMVAMCRIGGMSAQKAFNTVGNLLEDVYDRWNQLEAQVPSWGEEADIHVRKYIEGIKAVVKANLYWSFKSERYLGSNPERVRKTRRLEILADLF